MKFKPALPAIALALCSCRLTLIAVILSALAPLAARCAEGGTIYIGNSLAVPNGAEDGIPPLVILGEYSSAGPLAAASSATTLPNGTVQDVKFYGQDYDFTLYALSPVGGGPNANEQTFQVAASQSFCGIACAPGIQILPVSGFSVNAGELLAFSGRGPFYPQNPNDALNSDATYEDSSAPGSDAATPPSVMVGTTFTVGVHGDSSTTYDYISDYFGNQGRTYGIGVDVSLGSIIEPNPTNGIYVWTDETSSPVNQAALVNACTDPCHPISVVLLSAYNGNGGLWPTPNLQAFNTLAHAAGLRVFALFTDTNHISDLVAFNAACASAAQRFDACALDYEGDPPWPSGGGAGTPPLAAADIDYYARAKIACGSLPLHVSISYRWGTSCDDPGACITYHGVAKPSYQHILDQVDSVDVQTVFDVADVIRSRVQLQATYASQVGKPVWATIETQDLSLLPGWQTDFFAWNTFYWDGEAVMWDQLAQVSFAPFPFTEFMLHYYQNAYSSGSAIWPVHHAASLSPASALAGAGVTLTINGGCFAPTAQVLWNGVGLTTKFVSSSQLTAAVPASDLVVPRGNSFATALITLKNAGVALNPLAFTIFAGGNLKNANLQGANLPGANLAGDNLQNANLSGGDLQNADLSGANLQNANLAGAVLSGANLSGANLSPADLSGATLLLANLSGANLHGSNLQNANLTGANLMGANLQNANLTGANLTDANLTGANLHNATTTGAVFTGAITSGCNGCP